MFDVIGTLVRAAVYDGENEPVAAELIYPGWHVNTTAATLEARPDLEQFVVSPSPFRRVWAGDDSANPVWTVALRFADEAEARTTIEA